MDSNKDEALKCVAIAKEAIAAGDKQRALKFIRIARRLNHNLSADDLLAACENLDSSSQSSCTDDNPIHRSKSEPSPSTVDEISNGERCYTDEHVELIRKIKKSMNYYEILGVEKNCTLEKLKKSYKKLSLKVHPDKNKAPGSEEAFKIITKAFKCLSNEDSRRQYDHMGVPNEFEHSVTRRRRPVNDFFNEEVDPDEIFRTFFNQNNVYRTSNVYGNRRTPPSQPTTNQHGREDEGAGIGPNLMILLQMLPFLLIILLAFLPFSEPDYSLQKNYSYQFSRTTENHGVEFFVKLEDFDQKFPPGGFARSEIETNVIKDYKNVLGRYCHIERQRRQWNRNLPTPHCEKLQSFAVT